MPTVRPELADPIEQPIEAEPSFGYRTVAGLQGKNPIGDGYDGSCGVFASGGIRWRLALNACRAPCFHGAVHEGFFIANRVTSDITCTSIRKNLGN